MGVREVEREWNLACFVAQLRLDSQQSQSNVVGSNIYREKSVLFELPAVSFCCLTM